MYSSHPVKHNNIHRGCNSYRYPLAGNVNVAVYTVQQFFHVFAKLHSDTCRNLLNLTKCELDAFDFCLRIRMPRLSKRLILHVRQHEIVWKYIIWTYSGTEEAGLWQSRQRRNAFTSLGMKPDLKCKTTGLLQSRQKGSAKAELPIFGNEGRVLVEKPIFRSLAVKIERKCRNETANLWESRQRWYAEAELHIFGSPGRTNAESGTSDLCQSRESGSAEAELHIFGSQGRAEVQKRITFLAVNAERKCGRGTSVLWQ